MDKSNKTILVLGATGQQGGSVLSQLLAEGWKVRALTRDPNSVKAKTLIANNIEVIKGDLENRSTLDGAMKNVYGVFSVQPFEPIDMWKEVRLGKNVADAAKKTNVKHFVYTSFAGTDEQAKFRDIAKWEIEKYIQQIGLPATVFRLPVFMENFLAFTHYGLQDGIYADATNPNIPTYLIAVKDIGVFVSLAFKNPDKYLGKTIPLASDAVTPVDIAAAITKISGKTIMYKQIPLEELRRQNEDIAHLYEWINKGGIYVDLSYLRTIHPSLMTFDKWLSKKGKIKFEAFFQENKRK
ncbi:NmrA/HSCARG family protein [Shimazuella alba]|uniref:NmrA family NAD(P)-binding protein n=1 Tax=Shimazuella alba TaxID=2690964 RepID=A0A6I4VUK9_9BACL|nr:NmrA/HSCARG family protein [Shimazuella alba]MXQ53865.1 NmrA family NAD(P)-binding protein [Shimazuella alba]